MTVGLQGWSSGGAHAFSLQSPMLTQAGLRLTEVLTTILLCNRLGLQQGDSRVRRPTLLWAYATLGEPLGSACLEALAAQAQKQLPHFNEQALTNVMWAFAKLNHCPGATLLQSCEAHATCTAGAFTPQGLGALLRCLFQATTLHT